MRYRLRTLMLLLAAGPPVLASAFFVCRDNLIAWCFLILFCGLIALWMHSGGLSENLRYPPK